MIKNLFGNKPRVSNGEATEIQHDPATGSLLRAIDERRKTDPLIGAKIGAKEVNTRLANALRTENGVHMETLLHIIGSLAGYSCQASIRARVLEKGLPEDSAFMVVEGADKRRYFFGTPLNQPLAQSQYSVWAVVAGGAQQAGCSALPDLHAIFKHVTGSIGGEQFGIPQIPDQYRAGDLPINYLKSMWAVFFPLAEMFCAQPEEWPILFGLAAQEIILDGKSVLDPCMAAKIVMECAVPMSKVDLTAA